LADRYIQQPKEAHKKEIHVKSEKPEFPIDMTRLRATGSSNGLIQESELIQEPPKAYLGGELKESPEIPLRPPVSDQETLIRRDLARIQVIRDQMQNPSLLEDMANKEFQRHEEYIKAIDSYYDKHDNIKYSLTDKDRKYLRQVLILYKDLNININDISSVQNISTNAKYDYLSIKSDLQASKTLSEKEYINVNQRMQTYQQKVHWLKWLADRLDHGDTPNRSSSGSTME
jgi:hypothetical protein